MDPHSSFKLRRLCLILSGKSYPKAKCKSSCSDLKLNMHIRFSLTMEPDSMCKLGGTFVIALKNLYSYATAPQCKERLLLRKRKMHL